MSPIQQQQRTTTKMHQHQQQRNRCCDRLVSTTSSRTRHRCCTAPYYASKTATLVFVVLCFLSFINTSYVEQITETMIEKSLRMINNNSKSHGDADVHVVVGNGNSSDSSSSSSRSSIGSDVGSLAKQENHDETETHSEGAVQQPTASQQQQHAETAVVGLVVVQDEEKDAAIVPTDVVVVNMEHQTTQQQASGGGAPPPVAATTTPSTPDDDNSIITTVPLIPRPRNSTTMVGGHRNPWTTLPGSTSSSNSSIVNTTSTTSSYTRPANCTCWSATSLAGAGSVKEDTRGCCYRTIHRGHKMGYMMIKKMFAQYAISRQDRARLIKTVRSSGGTNGKTQLKYQPPLRLRQFFHQYNMAHHRNVIVMRDYVDAMVSGYLYHKSGHECTVDYDGRNRTNYTYQLESFPWENSLTFEPLEPIRGRHLCRYLAEESEEVGLRAYIDFAWNFWYKVYDNFIRFARYGQNQLKRKHARFAQRVLVVCYDDLNDAATRRDAFLRVMRFLYPGDAAGAWQRRPLPKIMVVATPPTPTQQQEGGGGVDIKNVTTTTNAAAVSSEYQGGHATDKDPVQRQRLWTLIEQFDRELFNNTLRRATAASGCHSAKKQQQSSLATTTRLGL